MGLVTEKIAIVTGAASGIGHHIPEVLRREGSAERGRLDPLANGAGAGPPRAQLAACLAADRISLHVGEPR